MTLLRESEVAERAKETAERKAKAPQPPVDRVRWIEWLVAVALLVGAASLVIFTGSPDAPVPDASPVLLAGRADPAIPEYLGASGGDLPVVESSPLVMGLRMDGVVHTPEFLGQSGGDLPAVESSPLTMGLRHEGIVHTPEFLGSSETEVPATP